MTLLVATRSAGKQREFARILGPLGVRLAFPDDVGLPPRSEEDGLELAETFEANARHKAEYFAHRSGLATVADDSGLEVFALGGAPGVRSRRWAGATGTPAVLIRRPSRPSAHGTSRSTVVPPAAYAPSVANTSTPA